MSEYWKSTPKYWCKHCSIYVKDTPFERKQHENTGKHQGNLKRFLRGVQNDHERNERDKQKVKDEVERLNRVVGGSSTATGATSTATNQTLPRKAPASNLTAADQKRQWTQLAEMGIAVPESVRGEMAMPGNWQTIAQEVSEDGDVHETLSKGVRKRKLDEDEIDEVEGGESTVRRGWGRSMRTYPGQPQEEDLDLLLNKPISKKVDTIKSELNGDSESGTTKTLHPATDTEAKSQQQVNDLHLQDEKNALELDVGLDVAVKVEADGSEYLTSKADEERPAMPVFKKRKAKAK